MLPRTAPVREPQPVPQEMGPVEINERVREIVDDIDNETGSRTAHSQRVSRLYYVCRDIQNAKNGGAKVVTVHKIIALLMLVLARSYGIGVGAR